MLPCGPVSVFVRLLGFVSISPLCPTEQKERIYDSLELFLPRADIQVHPIQRGHQDVKNYIVEVKGIKYLLKLLPLDSKEPEVQKELYMIEEAARIGIAPRIFGVSEAKRAVLMEYIEGATLTPETARQNAREIGSALRLLHESSENRHTGNFKYLDEAENRYLFIRERSDFKEARDAIQFIRDHASELSSSSVNIHGDLHGQNLFWTADGLKMLDWEWTTRDNPYLDLSRFSTSLALSEQSEAHLLEGYFKRAPTADEKKEYDLAKRLNFAYNSLICFKITAQILENEPSSPIDLNAEPQEWTFYMESFSGSAKRMSLQFFYDCARCSSKLYN